MKQLATLSELLHDDLLLIVRGNKLAKRRKTPLVYALADRSVQVSCQTRAGAASPLGGRQEAKARFATG